MLFPFFPSTFAADMISMAKSVSGKPRKATLEAARKLQAENHVEEILNDVKQNQNRDRKKELPVWLPLAASFKKGTRKAEDAEPSGLYFLDIDEKGLTETLWNKVCKENLVDEFRIVYFAESAGGGTHIWAWRTPGRSIEDDIQRLAERLGVNYDSHVTDLARCCFMVSDQYVKLMKPEIFEPLTDEQKALYATPIINKVEPVVQQTQGVQHYASTFKGMAYDQIVKRLLMKMGYGERPTDGERNNALFGMARYLRYICDFNAEWLFLVMPHWDLPDHEVMSTIKSAVATVRKDTIPAPLASLLTQMESEVQASDWDDEEEDDDGLIPRVPKHLPGILQQVADHAPAEFKEGSLMAILPMLGTVATGLRAKYRDDKVQSPSFIVNVRAPQATGKSFVDDLMALLMDPIIKQDEVEWQKEVEYSLAKKNGDEVDNPQAEIRIIEPNIGVTAFLERAIYAKGKHLFTYAPEIETVLKNNKGGAWTQKNDLIRLAYDNKPWGQHRISKDSLSGKVTLYYNMLMCGTPNMCRAYFADAESGTVTRTIFLDLPDMLGAPMPKFKRWTKEEEDEVKRECMCLMDEEGEVELPLLNKAIEEWDEGKRQEYLKTLRPAVDVFRRRSALNGFRAGMLAYSLAGHQETQEVIDFALWVAERCLYYQMKLYGNQVDALYGDTSETTCQGRNADLLSQLGKEFTKEELVNLRISNGQSPQVKMVIHRLKKEGMIEKIAPNLWRKCC